MSVSAGVLIVVVIFARKLLQRTPKWIHCILWGMVGIRLICPWNIEASFSLAPNAQVISSEVNTVNPKVQTNFVPLDQTANRYLTKYYFDSIPMPVKDGVMDPMKLISCLWICGVAVLLLYALFSYMRIYRKVRESIAVEENIYICDHIEAPFIFGIFNPRIYLPSDLKDLQTRNVLAHEKAHIKRLDYLWKPLGFLLLAVYWFQPLCWIAYILFCRDIEMACDERVVRDWSMEQKKEYSLALLSFHTPGKLVTACPLAFGEVSVKQRVKGVLNFRKPTFWLLTSALLACVIIAALFLTNPRSDSSKSASGKSNQSSMQQTQPDNSNESGVIMSTEESLTSSDQQAGNEDGQNSTIPSTEEESVLQAVTEGKSEQQAFAENWARAFSDRDGATIESFSSDKVKKKLEQEQLLIMDEGDAIFGWSSPWPMWDTSVDQNAGYTITLASENSYTASILYYAWSSDPHVTVWKEDVAFEKKEGNYQMTDETFHAYEYIASASEFDEAYPAINGTPMDYTVNGFGETLAKNALLSSSTLYQKLQDPVQACRYFLNLLDNENKVKVEETMDETSNGTQVMITFTEDGGKRYVKMIQPENMNGIWIPQDYE